jgi:hypothetical protein
MTEETVGTEIDRTIPRDLCEKTQTLSSLSSCIERQFTLPLLLHRDSLASFEEAEEHTLEVQSTVLTDLDGKETEEEQEHENLCF